MELKYNDSDANVIAELLARNTMPRRMRTSPFWGMLDSAWVDLYSFARQFAQDAGITRDLPQPRTTLTQYA